MIARIFGTGFGLGLSPVAPGTFGTLLGVAIAWLAPGPAWAWALGVSVLSVPLGSLAEKTEGEDPGSFVLDEVAGYLLAVSFLPGGWLALGAAFFAFRFFDIAKPWPIRKLERLPGGWGVLLDDLLAGIYAHGVVRLVLMLA